MLLLGLDAQQAGEALARARGRIATALESKAPSA